jgi:hypothetical protein
MRKGIPSRQNFVAAIGLTPSRRAHSAREIHSTAINSYYANCLLYKRYTTFQFLIIRQSAQWFHRPKPAPLSEGPLSGDTGALKLRGEAHPIAGPIFSSGVSGTMPVSASAGGQLLYNAGGFS